MDINFNIGFLKTVRQPIFESLNAALQNIKENHTLVKEGKTSVGGTLNTGSLEFLHKAKGALHMIDLPGVVYVLQQAEDVQKKIKENALNNQLLNAFAELESSIANVILYVEQLCDGELDNPSKLFQNYEALGNLLGQEINPKDLFFPKIDLLRSNQQALETYYKVENNYNTQRVQDTLTQIKMITSTTNFERNVLDVCQIIEHFKTAYEQSTVQEAAGVVFVQNLQNKTRAIEQSIEKLLALKINKHWHTLLNASLALMSTVSPDDNDNYIQYFAYHSKQIKFSLIKLTQEVSGLAKKLGEIVLNTKIEPTQAVRQLKSEKGTQKEIIYCVCVATAVNPKLRQSKGFLDLNRLINIDLYIEQLETQTFTASVGQKDPELVKALDKVLLDLKDEFVLVTSKNNQGEQGAYLKKMYSFAGKLNDLISQLEIETIQPLTQVLVETLSKTLTKQIEFNDIVKEEYSLVISFTEKLVDTYVKSNASVSESEDVAQVKILINRLQKLQSTGGGEELQLPLPVLSQAVLATEKNKVNAQVFTQLAKDLIKAEEIIDEFFRKRGENVAELSFVVTALNSARGILAMTGKKDLSALVRECIDTFSKLLNDTNSVTGDEVKKASSYIAGIILYVNALKNSNTQEADSVYNSLLDLSRPAVEHTIPSTTPIEQQPVATATHPTGDSDVENMLDFNFTFPTEKEKNTPTSTASTPVAQVKENEEESAEEAFDLSYSHKLPGETSAFEDNQTHSENRSVLVDTTNNEELCEIFLLEADEVLENLVGDFEALQNNFNDEEVFITVRRHFHTLKGSARMVGLRYLAEAAWLVEQTLNKQIEAQLPATPALMDFMKKTAHQIGQWVEILKVSPNKTLPLSLHEVSAWSKEVNPKAVFSFEVYPEHPEQIEHIEVQPTEARLEEKEEVKSLGFDLPAFSDFELTHNKDIPEVSIPATTEPTLEFKMEEQEHELSLADAVSVATESTVEDKPRTDFIQESVKTAEETKQLQEDTLDLPFDFNFHTDNTEVSQKENNESSTPIEHIQHNEAEKEEEISETAVEQAFLLPEEAQSEENSFEHILVEVPKETKEEKEVEDAVEQEKEPVFEEIPESEETSFEPEEHPEYVLIGNTQVASELYELYDTESDEHIANIEAYFVNHKEAGIFLSEDFTRYFHTLGSISGSVNLLMIKKMSRLIEDISRVSLDKNYFFDDNAVSLLEQSTNKIKEIKAYSIVEEDPEFHYIMNSLEDLANTVNEFEDNVDTQEVQEIAATPHSVAAQPAPLLDTEALGQLEDQLVARITQGVSTQLLNALETANRSLVGQLNQVLSQNENVQEKLEEVLEAIEKNQADNLETQFEHMKNQLIRGVQSSLKEFLDTQAPSSQRENTEAFDNEKAQEGGDSGAVEQQFTAFEEKMKQQLEENFAAIKEHNKRVMLNGLGVLRKDIQALATQKKKFFS